MQNRTDYRILCFSTSPNQTWTIPINDITLKVPKYIKYEINVYNIFIFQVCSQYFKFSFDYMC